MKRLKEGYNARLDESLGMRNRGRHKQSLKDRRDESKAMEKEMGRRAYSSVKTMDKGSRRAPCKDCGSKRMDRMDEKRYWREMSRKKRERS